LDVKDAAKVFREVENQAAAKRIASESRASAPRVNCNAAVACVADHGDDVFATSRPYDAERRDFKDARVAGVHLDEEVVAMHVAADQATQVFFNAKLFGVHLSRLN
jgi:hypothetical protein